MAFRGCAAPYPPYLPQNQPEGLDNTIKAIWSQRVLPNSYRMTTLALKGANGRRLTYETTLLSGC
jgi:hypothetical protein